jgi:hypothetical protein
MFTHKEQMQLINASCNSGLKAKMPDETMRHLFENTSNERAATEGCSNLIFLNSL